MKSGKFIFVIIILASIFFMLGTSSVSAQSEIKTAPVYVGYAHRVHSGILDEDRDLLVYLPRGADLHEHEYPVLYITDGSSNFHYSSGIVSFLSACDHIPEMIMVAIPHSSRDRDLAPKFEEGYKPGYQEYEGEADKFMMFLKYELMPYIESKYPTEPYRIYSGHSLGGIFGVYSMYTMPDLFDAYIIISAPLDWQNDMLIRNTRNFLSKNRELNKFMYLTMGDEGDGMLEPMQRFVDMLAVNAPEKFLWKYKYMPGESHLSTPLLSLYQGLELIFKDLRPPLEIQNKGLDAIEQHYRMVTERFGFEIKPPEEMLNLMGYRALRENKIDEAIKIFKHNTRLYPKSANVFDSLGDAYYENKQYDLAAQSYAKAVEKAAKSDDSSFHIYKTNLERAKQKALE